MSSNTSEGSMTMISMKVRMAEGIIKSADIERLNVPAAIAALMASKIDDPSALEFWVHRDSSTVFLVKPRENCR
jgi:hypothetical protein